MQNAIKTHNPEVRGSNPLPATLKKGAQMGAFFLLGYEIDLVPVIRGLLVPIVSALSDHK
jgi:hypothetical protein